MSSFRKSWILLSILCRSGMIMTEGTNRTEKFTRIQGYRYVSYTLRETDVHDVTACCIYCSEHLTCTASSYNTDEGLCRLSDRNGTALEQLTGWDVYIATERIGDITYSDLSADATQSSTENEGVASRAIDGIFATSWNSYSCTHTYGHGGPHWWRVDFGVLLLVGRVAIYNRSDCCGSRLRYLTLSISSTIQALDDTENVCATMESYSGTNPVTLTCAHKMVGHYLRIYKDTSRETSPSHAALTLCEVVLKP